MAKNSKIKRLKKEEVLCDALNQVLLRDMMSLVGDKWSICVLGALASREESRARFSELERSIKGISQRMLSTTLKDLERNGLLTREVFPEIPPRVEYELTNLGDSLTVPIRNLILWLTEHAGEMSNAREKFGALRSKLR